MELKGLNRRQRELADMIWQQDSREELEEIMSTLSEDDQKNCALILKLMMLELIDEKVNEMNSFPSVKSYLKKLRNKKL